MSIHTNRLVDTVGFEILGKALGKDVEVSLGKAIAAGAVFPAGSDPLSVFREALSESIRTIETNERNILFQRFLRDGPYEDSGKIPPKMVSKRLSDDETAAAIRFIYYRVINYFQGALGELLAAAPCCKVLKKLKRKGILAEAARLYIGDVVGVHRKTRKGILKGADFHILIEKPNTVTVAGVAEVKSYFQSKKNLKSQLDKHIARAKEGLCVNDTDYPPENVIVGYGKKRQVVRIAVLPDDLKLPRTFRFETTKHGRLLHVDPGVPKKPEDSIVRIRDDLWQITLRWSKEALAAAAFEMTFWYMGKVGEAIYSHGVPKEWSEMTAAQAGCNAAKMMLYYAILRCRTKNESQRAIALYNSYGFGYALGTNFKNAKGRREMLWPEDLDEILADGCTKHGCKLG
ncbi:MAG: hypothetical protein JW804_07450 [Sedimentisphaerales bacterium]|nr:hypothetical protein [Sedimentisphaerales bacterium]